MRWRGWECRRRTKALKQFAIVNSPNETMSEGAFQERVFYSTLVETWAMQISLSQLELIRTRLLKETCEDMANRESGCRRHIGGENN